VKIIGLLLLLLLLVYADDVKLMANNIDIVQRDTETLIDANKKSV
jgi:hypothetical protein